MSVPNPPPALKVIAPFILRSRELEQYKPIVSYYCKYYAIQQALALGVHRTDPSAAEYVGNLLDSVEKQKHFLEHEDAITDPVVAQAYLEQFVSEVFAHAEKDIINKTCSRKTATALFSASNFFELLKLFGEPDKNILEKIKYCKFNATRILKAIQNGDDPNEVVEAPVPLSDEAVNDQLLPADTPREHIPSPGLSLSASIGDLSLNDQPPPTPPTIHSGSSASVDPYQQSFTTSAPPTNTFNSPPPSAPISHFASAVSPPIMSVDHRQDHASTASIQQIMADAEKFQVAKKHAKYAISALNFEDVPSAVKELKSALQILGENVQ
ncbi:Vta1 like-domain-containing protein [Lipomyces oligophaga]|uniref:Vta1 like-domain-containing protein n=1 Tax=Lipomyces oligophaga TaxID=45792 RepID=UPI0034CF7C07